MDLPRIDVPEALDPFMDALDSVGSAILARADGRTIKVHVDAAEPTSAPALLSRQWIEDMAAWQQTAGIKPGIDAAELVRHMRDEGY